jgi:hypothetical protein
MKIFGNSCVRSALAENEQINREATKKFLSRKYFAEKSIGGGIRITGNKLVGWNSRYNSHFIVMAYDPEKHNRRSIRQKGHDYSSSGFYSDGCF